MGVFMRSLRAPASAARPAAISLAAALLVVAAAAPAHAAGGRDPALAQGLQWNLERIGAPQAWPRGTGAGVTIAIVDSGVDADHEDLTDQVARSVSCIGADGDPRRCRSGGADDDGHGTHVAGIAGAAADNGRGVAGVAPGAALLSVKALEHTCDLVGSCTASGTAADVIAAIHWATDQGADVINLSLGSTAQAVLGPSFAEAVRYAWSRGAIPVVAAGNGYVLSSGFRDEPAVVVTATTREDTEAPYASGVGEARWGIAAPGGSTGDTAASCATGGRPIGVLSTFWRSGRHDEYACLAGTSMAAPHVSGALAILLGAGFSPQRAVERVLGTAKDLGSNGRDTTFGWGRLDLTAATAGLPGSSGSLPATTQPTVTSQASPGGGSTTTSAPSGTPPTTAAATRAPLDPGIAAPADIDAPDTTTRAAPPVGIVAVAIALLVGSGLASGVTLVRLRGR
jgi:subtilisin family serine protease